MKSWRPGPPAGDPGPLEVQSLILVKSGAERDTGVETEISAPCGVDPLGGNSPYRPRSAGYAPGLPCSIRELVKRQPSDRSSASSVFGRNTRQVSRPDLDGVTCPKQSSPFELNSAWLSTIPRSS